MIIRVQKHERDFTIIENRALQDERLSYKATGLLAYLLSLPSDWRINREDLAAKKADGVAAVRSALNELEACGYLTREKKRLPNGTLQTTLIVHERPGSDPKTARPEAGNRAADTSTAENQPLIDLSTQTDNPDKEPPASQRSGSDLSGRDVERATPDPARELVKVAWEARKRDGKPEPVVTGKGRRAFPVLVDIARKFLAAGNDPELLALALYDHDGAWSEGSVSITLGKVRAGKATDPRLAAAMRQKRMDDEIRRQDEEWG